MLKNSGQTRFRMWFAKPRRTRTSHQSFHGLWLVRDWAYPGWTEREKNAQFFTIHVGKKRTASYV